MWADVLKQLVEVWTLVKGQSPEAAGLAVQVFVAVFGLRLVGVLKNGTWSRAANLVLSSILAGANLQASPDTATLLVLTAAFSGGAYELLSRFFKQFTVKVS